MCLEKEKVKKSRKQETLHNNTNTDSNHRHIMQHKNYDKLLHVVAHDMLVSFFSGIKC